MASITVEDVVRTRHKAASSSRAPGADEAVHDLEPGGSLTFGRGGPDSRVDLRLDRPEISRRAGIIRAVADYWLLSNTSSSTTYLVENLEGGGEHVKVPPRRLDAPVPFELARLSIPVDGGTYDLHVYAPQHAHLGRTPAIEGDRTVKPFSLDEHAKYFRVLVALCEPRLRDPASVAIPTSDEVADRLADGVVDRMSRSAVDYHIGYLAETKLRLRTPAHGDAEHDKRGALVSLALRFDLVTEDHLAELPRLPVRHPAGHP